MKKNNYTGGSSGIIKKTYSDKIFDIVNVLVMVFVLIIMVWPLWFVVIASVSDPDAVARGEVLLIPSGLTLEGYRSILEYKQIWIGYGNTIFYTVVGTLLNMIFSICLAYPLSEKTFVPRNVLTVFFMITMYFGGGLIPHYLLYRDMGIIDTRWAMIFPGMVSVYNSLIIRAFFQNSIPGELKESATLDGANAAQYLWKVVLPLSKAVFAVVGLYYMVGHWNHYLGALYYIYDDNLVPLQSVLKRLLIGSKMLSDLMTLDPEAAELALRRAQIMQYGVIMVAAVPMLCVYPFIQKYFVKGVMVGAVKG